MSDADHLPDLRFRVLRAPCNHSSIPSVVSQVPRIASGSVVKVKLTYTTVLKKRGGLVRLQCVNTNPKALM